MFKKMFDMFEPTENQLTPKALKRVNRSSIWALTTVPLLGAFWFIGDADNTDTIKLIILVLIIISMIPFTMACGSRLVNRAWTPDKYLDESEIARKRESATFSFIYTTVIGMVIAGFWLLWVGLKLPFPKIMQKPEFGLFILCFLVSTAMCLQAFKISKITSEFDHEGDGVEVIKADKNYWLIGGVIFVICMLVGFLMGYYVNH